MVFKLTVLQNTDAYRNNAEEAIHCIQALQDFATVDKLKDLPELYYDDNRLIEAAVSFFLPNLPQVFVLQFASS